MKSHDLEDALQACGDLLAAEGERARIIVVGGASLNLLGLIERTTSDVDVIARASVETGELVLLRAEPFPPALARAVGRVARDLELAPDWLNGMVGMQWSQGLPPGLENDLTWRVFGGLEVGLAGRRTLISLKLFAAADGGRRSVHVQDLLALRPTPDELDTARAWVSGQDASAAFQDTLQTVVNHVLANL